MIDVNRLASEAESYANEHAKDVSTWRHVAQEHFANLVLEEAAKVCDAEREIRFRRGEEAAGCPAESHPQHHKAITANTLAVAIRKLKGSA